MEGQPPNNPWLQAITNWPVLSLGLGALVFVLYQDPLTSPRKDDKGLELRLPATLQQYPLRLWQDPYSILHDRVARVDDNVTYATNRTSLQAALLESQFTNSAILGAFVESGVSPTAKESRIRGRHAVVMGLLESGYVPDNPDRIGLLTLPWPTTVTHASNDVVELPFERFSQAHGNHFRRTELGEKVTVFWIPEEKFEDKPLHRMALFRAMISRAAFGECTNLLRTFWLGPQYSSTLQQLVSDARQPDPNLFLRWMRETHLGTTKCQTNHLQQCWSDMRIHSHSATASDSYVLGMDPDPSSQLFRDGAVAVLRKHQVTFVNYAASDDRVAENLVEELQVRGLDLRSDPILIVSEADTGYGRAFPEAVSRALQPRIARSIWLNPSFNSETSPLGTNIHRLSFLRGLDGIDGTRALTSKDEKAAATSGDSKKVGYSDLGLKEHQEGPSHLDAFRRSVETFRTKNFEPKAVLVFATDAYDKLLILQALREEYPSALFATADLDARMTFANYLRGTRNLIVSSGYGLQLNDRLQGSVPPFRDSYQTGAFLAVKEFAGDCKPEKWIHSEPPRVFEIGLRGAWDLSETSTSHSPHPLRSGLQSPGELGRHLVRITLISILSLALAVSISSNAMNKLQAWWSALCGTGKVSPTGLSAVLPLAAAAAGASAFLGLVILAADNGTALQGEPFTFMAGISVWPGILIRGATCLVGIYLVVKALRTQRRLLSDLVQLATIPTAGVLKFSFPTFLASIRGTQSIHRWETRLGTSCPQVITELETKSSSSLQSGRILRTSLLYLSFGAITLLVLGEPDTPARGVIARTTSMVVLALCVMVHAVVTAQAIDFTKLISRFMRICREARPSMRQSMAQRLIPFAVRRGGLTVREVARIFLIAKAGDAALTVAYGPFLTLTGLVFARSNFFDNWDWPPSLILVLATGVLLSLYNLRKLRMHATEARQEVLDALKLELSTLSPANRRRDWILMAQAELMALRTGVFAPWQRDRVLYWLLLPLSGTALFEAVSQRLG